MLNVHYFQDAFHIQAVLSLRFFPIKQMYMLAAIYTKEQSRDFYFESYQSQHLVTGSRHEPRLLFAHVSKP